MTVPDLRKRTQQFALRTMRLAESLPRGRSGETIGRQLIRAGTSVGANYRSACRAKSQADFIAKMSLVEEEADETIYWMELLLEGNLVKLPALRDLLREANEVVAIAVASQKTARGHSRRDRTAPAPPSP
jgi:four helix bundle protein